MTNLVYWHTYVDQLPQDTIAHIPTGDLQRLVAHLTRLHHAIAAHHTAATSTVPVGGHPRHDTALWETLKDNQ
jgi:hypothetical protein